MEHGEVRDALETSTIQSAAFAAGFWEVILIFKTCQNAPFRARFWDMIKLELHRKQSTERMPTVG